LIFVFSENTVIPNVRVFVIASLKGEAIQFLFLWIASGLA